MPPPSRPQDKLRRGRSFVRKTAQCFASGSAFRPDMLLADAAAPRKDDAAGVATTEATVCQVPLVMDFNTTRNVVELVVQHMRKDEEAAARVQQLKEESARLLASRPEERPTKFRMRFPRIVTKMLIWVLRVRERLAKREALSNDNGRRMEARRRHLQLAQCFRRWRQAYKAAVWSCQQLKKKAFLGWSGHFGRLRWGRRCASSILQNMFVRYRLGRIFRRWRRVVHIVLYLRQRWLCEGPDDLSKLTPAAASVWRPHVLPGRMLDSIYEDLRAYLAIGNRTIPPAEAADAWNVVFQRGSGEGEEWDSGYNVIHPDGLYFTTAAPSIDHLKRQYRTSWLATMQPIWRRWRLFVRDQKKKFVQKAQLREHLRSNFNRRILSKCLLKWRRGQNSALADAARLVYLKSLALSSWRNRLATNRKLEMQEKQAETMDSDRLKKTAFSRWKLEMRRAVFQHHIGTTQALMNRRAMLTILYTWMGRAGGPLPCEVARAAATQIKAFLAWREHARNARSYRTFRQQCVEHYLQTLCRRAFYVWRMRGQVSWETLLPPETGDGLRVGTRPPIGGLTAMMLQDMTSSFSPPGDASRMGRSARSHVSLSIRRADDSPESRAVDVSMTESTASPSATSLAGHYHSVYTPHSLYPPLPWQSIKMQVQGFVTSSYTDTDAGLQRRPGSLTLSAAATTLVGAGLAKGAQQQQAHQAEQQGSDSRTVRKRAATMAASSRYSPRTVSGQTAQSGVVPSSGATQSPGPLSDSGSSGRSRATPSAFSLRAESLYASEVRRPTPTRQQRSREHRNLQSLFLTTNVSTVPVVLSSTGLLRYLYQRIGFCLVVFSMLNSTVRRRRNQCSSGRTTGRGATTLITPSSTATLPHYWRTAAERIYSAPPPKDGGQAQGTPHSGGLGFNFIGVGSTSVVRSSPSAVAASTDPPVDPADVQTRFELAYTIPALEHRLLETILMNQAQAAEFRRERRRTMFASDAECPAGRKLITLLQALKTFLMVKAKQEAAAMALPTHGGNQQGAGASQSSCHPTIGPPDPIANYLDRTQRKRYPLEHSQRTRLRNREKELQHNPLFRCANMISVLELSQALTNSMAGIAIGTSMTAGGGNAGLMASSVTSGNHSGVFEASTGPDRRMSMSTRMRSSTITRPPASRGPTSAAAISAGGRDGAGRAMLKLLCTSLNTLLHYNKCIMLEMTMRNRSTLARLLPAIASVRYLHSIVPKEAAFATASAAQFTSVVVGAPPKSAWAERSLAYARRFPVAFLPYTSDYYEGDRGQGDAPEGGLLPSDHGTPLAVAVRAGASTLSLSGPGESSASRKSLFDSDDDDEDGETNPGAMNQVGAGGLSPHPPSAGSPGISPLAVSVTPRRPKTGHGAILIAPTVPKSTSLRMLEVKRGVAQGLDEGMSLEDLKRTNKRMYYHMLHKLQAAAANPVKQVLTDLFDMKPPRGVAAISCRSYQLAVATAIYWRQLLERRLFARAMNIITGSAAPAPTPPTGTGSPPRVGFLTPGDSTRSQGSTPNNSGLGSSGSPNSVHGGGGSGDGAQSTKPAEGSTGALVQRLYNYDYHATENGGRHGDNDSAFLMLSHAIHSGSLTPRSKLLLIRRAGREQRKRGFAHEAKQTVRQLSGEGAAAGRQRSAASQAESETTAIVVGYSNALVGTACSSEFDRHENPDRAPIAAFTAARAAFLLPFK